MNATLRELWNVQKENNYLELKLIFVGIILFIISMTIIITEM